MIHERSFHLENGMGDLVGGAIQLCVGQREIAILDGRSVAELLDQLLEPCRNRSFDVLPVERHERAAWLDNDACGLRGAART